MSDQTLPVSAPGNGRQTFRLVDATRLADTTSQGGCGCGGHGAEGGCGCGGHGHAHSHAHPHDATATGDAHGQADATPVLVVHDLPVETRRETLFGTVDGLQVGEAVVIVAPHRPEPLFAHLETAEQHYRVSALEQGPQEWRYRISRTA